MPKLPYGRDRREQESERARRVQGYARGGRVAEGDTSINITVTPPTPQGGPMPTPPPKPPMPTPPMAGPGGPPGMGGPPGIGPGGPPGLGIGPPGMKRGGAAKMNQGGAAGGWGRIEKTRHARRQNK